MRKLKNQIAVITLLSYLFFSFQLGSSPKFSEDRGKLIYTKGIRASGIPIKAKLSGAEFDAKILPCSNCHGDRGEGNPEGGVYPSPLDWSSLTRQYTVEFKNGRKRSEYDHASLKKAIVEGIDPSGNHLDLVMPRYSLNDDDVSDLIAYLKIIDKSNEVGVTDTSIRVGVILPTDSTMKNRSHTVFKTIQAYLELVNNGGGVYNRKFQLTACFINTESENADSIFDKVINDAGIFVFIASDIDCLSEISLSKLVESKIPLIGIIDGNPDSEEFYRNRFYYLLSGLNQHIYSLFRFANDKLSAQYENFIVLRDSSSSISEIEVKSIFKEEKIIIQNIDIKNKDVLANLEGLRNDGIENVLFLGNIEEGLIFQKHVSSLNWSPHILLPGKFASSSWLDAPIKMQDKIHLSYPTWMTERNENAMQQYSLMASSYGLEKRYMTDQLNGLSSTILFTEVMKLAGKEVNHESVLEILHNLKDFQTGFIPPLSFGPNKRIGSERVFIVTADLNNKILRLDN